MAPDPPDSDARSHRLRRRTFAIAYRMTGSVRDAEDIVQESWIRRQSVSDDVHDEGALLATIATRLSIDRLRSASRRRERYVGLWLPEPLVESDDDPAASAEKAELLRMATLTLLERLTPPQRAAVVLRDAFGYPHREIAAILDITEPASRQHYSRALRRLRQGRKRFEVRPEFQEELLRRFARAADGRGTGQLEDLLADDVEVWADGGGMAPAPRRPVVGKALVARFVRGVARAAEGRASHLTVVVNGDPGTLVVQGGAVEGVYAYRWTAGGLLHSIHAVRNPDKLRHVRPGAIVR